MDLAQITRGEMVAAVSDALFLLVFCLAEWFGVPEASDAFASSVPDLDGWASCGFPFNLVLFLAGAAAVAQARSVPLRRARAGFLAALSTSWPPPARSHCCSSSPGSFFPPELEVGGVEIPDTTRELGAFLALRRGRHGLRRLSVARWRPPRR